MRAAASLLLLLGRLRASLSRAGAGQLMDQVAQAIQQFEVDARAAGAPADQVETAKYALAATADDIVQNLPSEDSRVWTQYSMLVRFFNERMGGVRFFQELDRAKQNPAVNLGLLEVMHACLSLGFEGVYRATGGPGRTAGHSPRPLRDDPPRPAQDDRGSVAALARPDHRACRKPVSGSRLVASRPWPASILLGAYLLLRNMLAGRPRRSRSRWRRFIPTPKSPSPAKPRSSRRRIRQARRRRSSSAFAPRSPRKFSPARSTPISRRPRSSSASAASCCFLRAGQASTLRSPRSPRRSPPRSTRSPARSTSTAIPTPIRSARWRSLRISNSPRRAPNRSPPC